MGLYLLFVLTYKSSDEKFLLPIKFTRYLNKQLSIDSPVLRRGEGVIRDLPV